MPVMRDDVRPLGVVYTPPEVARPMVELALRPLIDGKKPEEILALRICDPAIGEGAFLVEVIEVLARALAEHGEDIERARRRVARSCIRGVDVDTRAVEAARIATDAPPGALQVGDALALDWAAAFPDVFSRGGFDAVIANPPYIRQEWLADKARLQRFTSYSGVADLYVYFIELAHELLRETGRYCLIVPSKWLTAAYGAPLRTMLAAHKSVDGVADLSAAKLFAGADAFPCIVWGTSPRGRVNGTLAGGTSEVRVVRAEPSSTVADALAGGELVSRARWGSAPWHLDGGGERALLERIERMFPRLDELVRRRPSRGVVTGCNRAFVIDRETRDRLVGSEPAAAALIRPFVKGRDIRRWRHVDAERYVLLIDRGTAIDELPTVRAHLQQFRVALEPRPEGHAGTWSGRKPGSYAWYELQDPVGPLVKARMPRLLYQDIQTAPACSLDATGDVVPDTTVWMLPTDDRFVLAVLNSSLYGWYARRRFPPALNGAVRPKLAYLTALPVPRIEAARRVEICALVEQQLADPSREHDDVLARRIADAVSDAYELSAAERALIS